MSKFLTEKKQVFKAVFMDISATNEKLGNSLVILLSKNHIFKTLTGEKS